MERHPSAVQWLVTIGLILLACAAGLAAQHSTTLSWTASTTAGVTYNVYRGTVSGGPYTLLTSIPVGVMYTDSAVSNGATYFYVARADMAGVESDNSNEVKAVIPTPATVVAISISPTSAAVSTGSSVQFHATVTGSTNTAVNWTVQNGIISSTGLYGAPATTGVSTVTATALADTTKKDTASITVAALPTVTTLSVLPVGAIPAVNSGDTKAVELGMKFTSDVPGSVMGVCFYKGPLNTGIHTGSLWAASGARLTAVVFTNETASGRQCMNFAAPALILANTLYTVSYHSNTGFYSYNSSYFTSAVNNGVLHAPVNAGVFTYGAGGVAPTVTYQALNYWVDVMFIPGTVPPPISSMTKTCTWLADSVTWRCDIKTVNFASGRAVQDVTTSGSLANTVNGIKP